MAEFVIGTDISTDNPVIEVTVTADKPLAVGRQIFRLIVVDDSGNQSQADQITVIVADQDAPTAVLSGPQIVGTGKSFKLNGERSFDVGGGKVVQYIWTYVGPAIT